MGSKKWSKFGGADADTDSIGGGYVKMGVVVVVFPLYAIMNIGGRTEARKRTDGSGRIGRRKRKRKRTNRKPNRRTINN